MTLRKCLSLHLVLPFERLRAASRSRLLRGLRVISCLLLLEFLPLLFLTVTQVILLLLVHFVASGISRGWCRLVDLEKISPKWTPCTVPWSDSLRLASVSAQRQFQEASIIN